MKEINKNQGNRFTTLIGGHVSIAGGLSKAIERAVEREFNLIQIFASSPRSYKPTIYSQTEIDKFKLLYSKYKLKGLFFHAIYLLNLASDKEYLVNLSIQSLIDYLNFGTKLGAIGTIFHVGSSKSQTFDQVKEQVVKAMLKVFERTPKDQFLILESAAGAGSVIGQNLTELAYLYKHTDPSRVRICLDTQHLWASGINVADYAEFNQWLKEFDQQIGIKNLVCLHINDSKTPLGSKKDRHENIGKGKIGLTGFKNILKQPLLKNIPYILEVPGMAGQGPDKENIEILKGCVPLKI